MSGPVLEASDLPTLPKFLLLDVRSRDAFASSHPANAVRVPVEVWEAAAKKNETSFENVAYWEQQIGALGVSGTTPTVVYDGGGMLDAARVWFILQYFGAQAFLLNGGLQTLSVADPKNAIASSPVTFRAKPGSGPVGLVDRHTLKADLSRDIKIFDARTEKEYTGEDLKKNSRGGHLPGARLLSHGTLLEGGKLKPAATLRKMLETTGFQPGDSLVTHCDGGGRAALAALAAVQAGYSNVRAYYLSFADWAKDESCPIVRD